MSVSDDTWKVWSEAFVREVSQLRLDLNKHVSENREDLKDIFDRLDKITELFQQFEKARMEADHAAELSIKELQTIAKLAGKEGGKEEATKDRIYFVIASIIYIGLSLIGIIKGEKL